MVDRFTVQDLSLGTIAEAAAAASADAAFPFYFDDTPCRVRAVSTQSKMGMVDCNAYAASLKSESLSNFNNWLNGGIHGPVR